MELPYHDQAWGSPPRMRGKEGDGVNGRYQAEDHPRVCGEKRKDTLDYYYPQGSPPRMRGKAVPAALPDVTHGITPAYAGKRNGRCSCSTAGRDHPRVCGEKSGFCQRSILHLGSPPRMRGKGLLQVFIPEPLRITPACAGKSAHSDGPGWHSRDHPRVCGEK